MSNKNSSNGLGFGTVVFLIFLLLKLAEIGAVAKWSWWWVTSPLWIPLVLVAIFFPLYVFIKLIGKK
jgi:hypothetical protein